MRLTGNEISTGLAIAPIESAAGTVTGVVIDRKGYNSGVITCLTGLASGSPTVQSASFQVKSCATSGGSYADITDKVVAITADATAGEVNLDLSEVSDRYLKVVCTIAFTGGTSPKIEVASSYALGQKKYNPA